MAKAGYLPPNKTRSFLELVKELYIAYMADQISLSRLRLWLLEEIQDHSQREVTECDDHATSLYDQVMHLLETMRGIARDVRRAEFLAGKIIDHDLLWMAPNEEASVEYGFLMAHEEHEIRRLCKAANDANPDELWPYLSMYCLCLLISDTEAQRYFAKLALEHKAAERDLQRFRIAFSIVED